MSAWLYTATNEANLMKIKYGKLIEKQFNKKSVLMARFKKLTDFVGKQIEIPIIQSIGGSVSSGTLPTANPNKIGKATLTTKKVYAATSIDRESMAASKTDEGAFVRLTKFPVQIAVQSFNRNIERMLTVGDATGTGALITGHASNAVVTGAGTSGDPYVVTFDAAAGNYSWASSAPFEEGDLLNVNSETTEVSVLKVIPANATLILHLVGTSSRLGTLAAGCGTAFGGSDKLYMENSKDSEMIGVRGAIAATSSTLYGVDVGRRWQAYQKDANAAEISTDLINEMVVNIERQAGEAPKLVLTSHKQYIKLLNKLEDAKMYVDVKARTDADISFSGIQIATPSGAIPVLTSRFIPDAEMFFLNDDHLELHLRPGGFEWFNDDGTVFLRNATADQYDARYGGYGQTFINPHFQGYLYDLAV